MSIPARIRVSQIAAIGLERIFEKCKTPFIHLNYAAISFLWALLGFGEQGSVGLPRNQQIVRLKIKKVPF